MNLIIKIVVFIKPLKPGPQFSDLDKEIRGVRNG